MNETRWTAELEPTVLGSWFLALRGVNGRLMEFPGRPYDTADLFIGDGDRGKGRAEAMAVYLNALEAKAKLADELAATIQPCSFYRDSGDAIFGAFRLWHCQTHSTKSGTRECSVGSLRLRYDALSPTQEIVSGDSEEKR